MTQVGPDNGAVFADVSLCLLQSCMKVQITAILLPASCMILKVLQERRRCASLRSAGNTATPNSSIMCTTSAFVPLRSKSFRSWLFPSH